ncbi:MAG: S1/P1 nuclease [Ferruginibacter sp.]
MSSTFLKRIFLFAAVLYLPFAAAAWGVLGHRIVGEIADQYLSADAKKEIKILLGNESVAISSNWMDFIRSDSTTRYLNNWHYLNLRPGLALNDYNQFINSDTTTNAYTKINWLAAQLKNKALPKDTRAMYLKFLIHLVGDVHQPLHVGRPDDQGGNRIRLTWFNDNVNLHQVWDEKLINFQQLSYTEYAKAINFTTKAQRLAWQQQPLRAWIWESYQHAENIYADVKADDKLGYYYNYKYISIVNEQLLKGGVRLAGLLNQIFD